MKITNSGYSEHGASRRKTSLIKWNASSKSPHEDISENLQTLRERSRDLYAGGGPLGRGAIDRLVLNAIGPGLRLNVRISPQALNMDERKASEWAAKVEAEYDYWASSRKSHSGGELSFYDLQVLALKSILLDGEVLVRIKHERDRYKQGKFPYFTKIQLIESERIQTPNDRQNLIWDEGVALDSEGQVIGYNVKNRNPYAELSRQPVLEDVYLPVDQSIMHLFIRERISQHRGVPFLAPVILQLKQLSIGRRVKKFARQ